MGGAGVAAAATSCRYTFKQNTALYKEPTADAAKCTTGRHMIFFLVMIWSHCLDCFES